MDDNLIKKILTLVAIILSIVLLFKIIGLIGSIFFKVVIIALYATALYYLYINFIKK